MVVLFLNFKGERISQAESKLAEAEADRDRLQAELDKQVTVLTDKCNQLETEKEELEARLMADIDSLRKQILSKFCSVLSCTYK